MTAAADLIVTNAEAHTLTDPDTVHEAVAVRDGAIVRLGDADELAVLEGVETDVLDCEGRVVLPGFIDAHTHMEQLGQHVVHADLSSADSAESCIDLLLEQAEDPDPERILGFGYDESAWNDSRTQPLTREDLALTPLETATVAGRDVPVRWRIELPARDLDITTEPVNPDSWMEMFVPYWEGPVRASGSHTGRGFMELTGYE